MPCQLELAEQCLELLGSEIKKVAFLRQLHYCPSSPTLLDATTQIPLESVYFSRPVGITFWSSCPSFS